MNEPRDVPAEVVKYINQGLNIQMNLNDIKRAHYIGKSSAIICKFYSFNLRQDVFAASYGRPYGVTVKEDYCARTRKVRECLGPKYRELVNLARERNITPPKFVADRIFFRGDKYTLHKRRNDLEIVKNDGVVTYISMSPMPMRKGGVVEREKQAAGDGPRTRREEGERSSQPEREKHGQPRPMSVSPLGADARVPLVGTVRQRELEKTFLVTGRKNGKNKVKEIAIEQLGGEMSQGAGQEVQQTADAERGGDDAPAKSQVGGAEEEVNGNIGGGEEERSARGGEEKNATRFVNKEKGTPSRKRAVQEIISPPNADGTTRSAVAEKLKVYKYDDENESMSDDDFESAKSKSS